jgi:hypothetical protein
MNGLNYEVIIVNVMKNWGQLVILGIEFLERNIKFFNLGFGIFFVIAGLMGIMIIAEEICEKIISLVYCGILIVGIWLIFKALGG